MPSENEIRCPEHKFRLFGKLVVDKQTNLVQVKCRECTKEINKSKNKDEPKASVYHYYDILSGKIKLVKTEIRYDEKVGEENGSNNNNN